jgi:predicted Zn-dependent protease
MVVLSLGAGWLSPTSALRNPSEDLRLTAVAFSQTASLRQAEPFLEDAVKADPRNLDARASLAQAYQQDGLINAAADQLKAAFAADSTHTATLFGLAMLDQVRGEPDESLSMMTRLVRLRPNNPLYLNELGQMLMRGNDLPTAQVLLQKALRLKPDYTIAQQNLDVVETYLRHLEQSLIPPEMHLAEDDPLTGASNRIVQAMDDEKWSEADSLIGWTEHERPGFVQPHWFRAAYDARRGDVPGAIAALERCQRLAPGRPMVVQQLVALYLKAGQSAKVEPLLVSSLAAARGDSTRAMALESMLEQFREGK